MHQIPELTNFDMKGEQSWDNYLEIAEIIILVDNQWFILEKVSETSQSYLEQCQAMESSLKGTSTRIWLDSFVTDRYNLGRCKNINP